MHVAAQRSALQAVVTQPDRPAGRGRRMRATAVKEAALALGVPVLEPGAWAPTFAQLERMRPHFFLVVAYGRILPASLLAIPSEGALNVHPSMLPLYRGATPIEGALRDGRTQAGVSVIHMDAGMDTGDVALQEPLAIGSEENYGQLHDRLAALGASLLERALALAAAGTLAHTPQRTLANFEQAESTLTRPLSRADLVLDWAQPSRQVCDKVRAFAPEPAARALVGGIPVKIVAAHPVFAQTGVPGAMLGTKNGALLVACGDGALAIERLRPPNRATMSGAQFYQSFIA